MDFLRRLNPTRSADAAAARPDLPSRFARPSPLNPVAAASAAALAPDGTVRTPESPGFEPPSHGATDRRPDHREAADTSHAVSPASHLPAFQRVDRNAAQSIDPSTDGRPAAGKDTSRPGTVEPASSRPTAPPDASRLDAQSRARESVRTAPAGETAQAANIAVPDHVTARERARVPAAAREPGAAPLSDATVAARAVRSSERRPVIQVTIDRIDVRVAETPRAAPAKRPAPPPSVSLEDYLRADPIRRPRGVS